MILCSGMLATGLITASIYIFGEKAKIIQKNIERYKKNAIFRSYLKSAQMTLHIFGA